MSVRSEAASHNDAMTQPSSLLHCYLLLLCYTTVITATTIISLLYHLLLLLLFLASSYKRPNYGYMKVDGWDWISERSLVPRLT